MTRRPNKSIEVVRRNKHQRDSTSSRSGLGWKLSRGRNDLAVNERLVKAIEEKARQKRWNPAQKRAAERFADALIFGNGLAPRDADREVRITVERAFVNICLDLGLKKGALPGQNNNWYDRYVKTIQAGR